MAHVRSIWALAALLGAVVFAAGWVSLDRTGQCGSDFSAFYSGGRLLLEGSLYDQAAVRSLQSQILGCGEAGNSFIRLPFFAAAMAPLAQLPYADALVVWKLILICAAAAFILLWPGPRWRTAALLFWSLPLVTAFAYGQDTVAILTVFAASLRMSLAGQPGGAGALLALGAVKIHLFLWAPALALLRRRGRFLAFWAVAGGFLVAVSFLAAGLSWPAAFAASALQPSANPHVETMVNFRGLFHASPHALALELLASLALAAAIVRPLLRWPFEDAACLALAASIPIGHHSYLYDLVFVLPLCLILLNRPARLWLRTAAVVMAAPILPLLPMPWSSESTCQVAVPVFILCAAYGYDPEAGRGAGKPELVNSEVRPVLEEA